MRYSTLKFDATFIRSSKTIQSIGFLSELQRGQVNVRGPFLIVAPLSLVSQWESEAKEWAPDVNCVVYHGS